MKGIIGCEYDAAVQCLAHVPQLVEYAREGADEELNKKRVNACAVLGALFDVMREYWSSPPTTSPTVDASSLVAAMTKTRTMNKTKHHDAHVALMALIKTAHDALCKTPPELLDVPHRLAEAWAAQNDAEGYSMLAEIFRGQSSTSVEPIDGGETTVTYDHWWDVSIGVEGSLVGGLARIVEPKTVFPHRVRTSFISLPLVLIARIKRFEGRERNDKFVDYPVDLELVDAGGLVRYSLFAVIVASKDSFEALTEVDGVWSHSRGEMSSTIDDLNQIIRKDAYILMYKRLDR